MKLTNTSSLMPVAIALLVILLLPLTTAPTTNAYLSVIFPTSNLLLSATSLFLTFGLLFGHIESPLTRNSALRATTLKVLLYATLFMATLLVIYSITSFFVTDAVTVDLPFTPRS